MATASWLYTRGSHDEQELTLESQLKIGVDYIDRHQLPAPPVVLVDQGVSASRTRLLARRYGQRLRDAQRGDHIVICTLDRAFRNDHDQLTTLTMWELQGINVHVVNLPAAASSALSDRFLVKILGLMNWMESERTGERIKECFKVMRDQNRPTNQWHGYGWRKDHHGVRTPDPEVRKVCELIAGLHKDGVGYIRIKARLEADGIRPPGRSKAARFKSHWTLPFIWRLHQAYLHNYQWIGCYQPKRYQVPLTKHQKEKLACQE